jgi:hypothetical protein
MARRIVGAVAGAACGIAPLFALDLIGRGGLLEAELYAVLRAWINPGIPIGAISGAVTGIAWAHQAWRRDRPDWWLAGAVAGTAFVIGLAVAAAWAFAYPAASPFIERIGLAMLVVLGALPMVVAAFVAALAWLGLMHLAATVSGPDR